MACITIDIVVDDVATLHPKFTHIKVYRSITGETGAFVELTTAATRPVLDPNQTSYPFEDRNGDAAFFYTVSYFNQGDGLESDQSVPIPGAGDPALSLVSVEELKQRYLFGLDLTDDSGVPLPDSVYAHYIRSAVSWLEIKLDINIVPTVILDERHDFFKQDYYKYIWLKLDNVPLLSVEQIRLVLPTDQEVIIFDPSWIEINEPSGQTSIIPGNGQLSVITLGQTGAWLPLIYGWTDFIPNVFRVNYTAGFPLGKVPHVLIDLIGKIASMGPFNIFGDLVVGAGIASTTISIDGLSQSINSTSSATNAGYGARLIQYAKEIKEVTPQLRRTFHPITIEAA